MRGWQNKLGFHGKESQYKKLKNNRTAKQQWRKFARFWLMAFCRDRFFVRITAVDCPRYSRLHEGHKVELVAAHAAGWTLIWLHSTSRFVGADCTGWWSESWGVWCASVVDQSQDHAGGEEQDMTWEKKQFQAELFFHVFQCSHLYK